MPDDDNLSELLDDDKLPAEYPPDRPLGVDEEELTVRGQQTDEPLAERVRREEPDVLPEVEADAVGSLVAPGGDEGLDLVKESVATDAGAGAEGDELDAGDIASGDTTTRDVATERAAGRSAEEEAVHLTDDPPLGDGDGYLS
ncbi:MAG TPA: hypothetical protein VK988_15745 [Acidimicrobiales bacterium]|nr:hypothetical protein [Acidimicrobiales bacterium]